MGGKQHHARQVKSARIVQGSFQCSASYMHSMHVHVMIMMWHMARRMLMQTTHGQSWGIARASGGLATAHKGRGGGAPRYQRRFRR